MIPYKNCAIIPSVIFFLAIKIFCSFVIWFRAMYKKQPTLTSIPERNENEEENLATKWVPKKKHEVLKAKYKCLKKLFQIYDASVIGILPETYANDGYLEEQIQTKRRRKKRSHRAKIDACAGTNEISSEDITQLSTGEETEKESVATAVIRDLKLTKQSCTSTQMEADFSKDKNVSTQDSRGSESIVQHECEFTQTIEPQSVPYMVFNEKPRRTRFQCFINRIFGTKPDRACKSFVLPNGHIYASSDNSIYHNYGHNNYTEKRRRRGLRFRRLKRPKKIQSEGALRDMKSPFILTYVQSVQQNCLMDTTPRQCPIVGCNMISYGIINYNDHLNLCHFTDRKHICHYCHEGFENEYDKFIHENEHIGISKLGTSLSTPSSARQSANKKASNTQTDPEFVKSEVPEEKLKKIVSFFDKISDPDQYLTDIEKNRFSDTKIQSKTEAEETGGCISDTSDKKTVSCGNLNRKTRSSSKYSSGDSEVISKYPYNRQVICHFCGEHFDYRRQLSLHVDLEHRVHDKFSKFHSCAGILNKGTSNHMDLVSEDGKLNVQSIDRTRNGVRRVNTSSTLSQGSYTEISRRKSDESLSCDPSTNIMYYTSVETVKKPSVVNSIVQKVRSGLNSYKWEPGTKIIRV